ncbi:MAG TPA: hemerythrin domain-containing protein [Pyrinomonadaceae bacterium]
MVESVTNIFTGGDETQTNAIDLLTADHRKVEELFKRVRDDEDGAGRRTFPEIRRELEAHTHIEEQVFYPHLLKVGDEKLQSITREGLEEHRQVKVVLDDIETASNDRDGFEAKIKVLMEDVEHHVDEEEGEMFPLVRSQVDEEMLVRLGALLEAEKKRFADGASIAASAR